MFNTEDYREDHPLAAVLRNPLDLQTSLSNPVCTHESLKFENESIISYYPPNPGDENLVRVPTFVPHNVTMKQTRFVDS